MVSLPPSSLHWLPPQHLVLPSQPATQRLRVTHRLNDGAGSPTPTSFHLLPSKTVHLLSSRYLLPTHPLHSHVLCHFAKCSWDYLRTAPTQSCSALQDHNLGFIKLNLTGQRTAREINFKVFSLKCTVSKLCPVYHSPSLLWQVCPVRYVRGSKGEAKAGHAASSLSFECSGDRTAQIWLYNPSFSFCSLSYMHFLGKSDYKFKAVTVLQANSRAV